MPPYTISPPLFALTLICISITAIYLILLYIKILCEGKNTLWRSSVWMGFTCYFIVVLFVSLYIESVGLYGLWSTKIIIFLMAMNLYVVYMQDMFSPFTEETQTKVNFHPIQQEVIEDTS